MRAGKTEKENKLTPKQAAFVAEYMIDRNGTQAAIRAGYSPRTANEQAARLLAKANVREAVDKAQEGARARAGVTADMVIDEYRKLAFFDARKMFDEGGRPMSIGNLDDDTAAAIVGLDVMEEYDGHGSDRELVGLIKKYKIADKKGALDSLARHLGLFNDRVQLSGCVSVEALVKKVEGDEY